MAPPWEPWAVLNELPRRLKHWLARPVMKSGTPADDRCGCQNSSASSVDDSSDLLRRRMSALHLDPDDVDRPAAQLVGIQTGLCASCSSRGKCMRALDDEFTDPGWGDWRNYCPNATTLSILSTLGSCVEDKQKHGDSNEPGDGRQWQLSETSDEGCSCR